MFEWKHWPSLLRLFQSVFRPWDTTQSCSGTSRSYTPVNVTWQPVKLSTGHKDNLDSGIKTTRKDVYPHLHSVGWSGRRDEGLCDHCGASCLGLFQQTQLVGDVGHLLLQALSFNTDLCDFLSSWRRQKRLFEVYQVKRPPLLQAHQSA